MKPLQVRINSLSAQIIISFVALVLLTAFAAGMPAVWLLRQQLETQAWAQVAQGGRAAQALYTANQNEMANLAILTAQRPTLRDLLATPANQEALQIYLNTLQAGAGLDFILVCRENEMAAYAGNPPRQNLCQAGAPDSYYVTWLDDTPQVWLISAQAVTAKLAPNRQEFVIVGLALDDEFAAQMQDQTGLEHTLLVNNQPLATSLTHSLRGRQTASLIDSGAGQQGQLIFNNQPFYFLKFPLPASETKLEAEVALPVADIVTTQQKLAWTLVGSIIAVAALGSSLGILLVRQISRPLARLTTAADAFSRGDLTRPVNINTRLREVALVGAALEAARVDLKLTLGDLQREKAWIDHLLEAIVEGIVTLDRSGHIIFFSRGAERITGWSRNQALGRSCDEIFHTLDANQPFSQLFLPPGRHHKVEVTLKDGRQIILAVTSAKLLPPDASDARLVLVFRDVSEAEAAHRLMGHFIANIAHEFRTPLSSLAASIELLLDQSPDLSAAELQELIISLHLGIVSLQTLVDNLLEGASIEAGRFRVYVRPVQLVDIMAEAARIMQPLLNKYGQQLVVKQPPRLSPVLADPRRAVQVLVNLLSNASRYGPADAEIVLEAAQVNGWVRVSVADQGPGIAPAYRNDLFRRFVYPAENDDKMQYGVGLGLSVVKAIVEAQGGQVGVEDRPGGGSIFWFTLAVEQNR